jgi:hypothetical protein
MNKVSLVFLCHDIQGYNEVVQRNLIPRPHIVFIGNEPLNAEIENDPLVIIARNQPDNIEGESNLSAFTAWYLIAKNGLFLDSTYLVLLDGDVVLQPLYYANLIKTLFTQPDVVGLMRCQARGLYDDINMSVFDSFLKSKNATYDKNQVWYSKTNHCLKRKTLVEFVDWYYPSCLEIKRQDCDKLSWYHERLFFAFLKSTQKETKFCNSVLYQQPEPPSEPEPQRPQKTRIQLKKLCFI